MSTADGKRHGLELKEILLRLSKIESERKIKILYVCEGGSRAMGLDTPYSDYDIYFLYAHYPEWYLSIEQHAKDAISVQDKNIGLDIAGWELRKALNLLRKSNFNLIQLINSPIKYTVRGETHSKMKNVLNEFISPKAMAYHCRSVAMEYYDKAIELKTKTGVTNNKEIMKNYTHALFYILATKWIVANHSVPPLLFTNLLASTVADDNTRQIIENLILQIRNDQIKDVSQVQTIDNLISGFITHYNNGNLLRSLPIGEPSDIGVLNEIFRTEVLGDTSIS